MPVAQRSRPPRLARKGFSLVETLVALGVLATLLALVVPIVAGAQAAAHAGAARAALLESLMTAANHAATRSIHVVLCPSVDGAVCSGQPDWSHGWIAFADRDGDRSPGTGETHVHRQPPLGGSARLVSTTGRTRLVFQPNGGNAGSNVTFTLCDGRGAEGAVGLVLANHGRLRESPPRPGSLATCMGD